MTENIQISTTIKSSRNRSFGWLFFRLTFKYVPINKNVVSRNLGFFYKFISILSIQIHNCEKWYNTRKEKFIVEINTKLNFKWKKYRQKIELIKNSKWNLTVKNFFLRLTWINIFFHNFSLDVANYRILFSQLPKGEWLRIFFLEQAIWWSLLYINIKELKKYMYI